MLKDIKLNRIFYNFIKGLRVEEHPNHVQCYIDKIFIIHIDKTTRCIRINTVQFERLYEISYNDVYDNFKEYFKEYKDYRIKDFSFKII